jgi:hypothetical protein
MADLCNTSLFDGDISLVGKKALFRAMAKECFKWAREAHSDEVRESYLQSAQIGLDAASHLDGRPPTRRTDEQRPFQDNSIKKLGQSQGKHRLKDCKHSIFLFSTEVGRLQVRGSIAAATKQK